MRSILKRSLHKYSIRCKMYISALMKRGHEKLTRNRDWRDRNVTAGCRPAVIINELPIDCSLPRGSVYIGSSSRSALITLAQLEGRNSKRIIDRIARPVAVFQRFTASGTTSISLRQSLPSCLPACLPPKSHDRARELSWHSPRHPGPNPNHRSPTANGQTINERAVHR